MRGEIPGHRASGRTALLFAAILAGVIVAAVLGGLAWMFLSGGDGRPRLLNVDPGSGHPLRIEIRSPSPGARLPAGDPASVLVRAFDGLPVAKYELWVDGELARQLTPSDPATSAVARMTWLPGEPGTHVLVARGITGDGSIGRSAPVVVEALPDPHAGLIGVGVQVGEGATVASIAQVLGASPQDVIVPGGRAEPQPGDGLVVYLPPDRLPEGYVDDDGPRPAALPTPDPEPPDAGAAEAQPADDAAPDELPWGFDRLDDPGPPGAPADLRVTRGEGCAVRLDWRDTSDTETGFRVYRFSGGGNFRAIRELDANDGVGALTFTDRVLFGGHVEYYIASANSGGESDSNLAGVDVPEDACAITVPPAVVDSALMLQFEATSLQTDTQFDDAYCYLSLARLEPYARIPDHDDAFLAPTRGGGWDIGQYASGIDRRVFMQAPGAPVPVRMECWGRRGGEEPNLLGSFEASHPREEWDGRNLFGNADGFRAVYRIEPYIPRARAIAIEDGRIPVPSNVHIPDDRDDCDAHADFSDGDHIDGRLALWACAEIADRVIAWDWDESPAFPREEIGGFRVRYRVFNDFDFTDDTPVWQTLGEVGPYAQLFPIPMPSCDEMFVFVVTAVVAPEDGREERESPHSPHFRLERRGCPPPEVEVEITLVSVDVSATDDGVGLECLVWPVCVLVYDFVLEAYGSGGFNVLRPDGLSQVDYGTNFLFFTHDCGGQGETFLTACVGFHPLDVGVAPLDERTIRFEDQQMATCTNYRCTAFGTDQNTFTVAVRDGDSIEFWFNLRDDDDGSTDDTWCGTDEDYGFESEIDESRSFVIGPYSLEEWLDVWTEEWSNRGHALDDQDADCTMDLFFDGSRIER